MNQRWPEGSSSRELARLPAEYPHPALAESSMGDYYYGRAPSNTTIARSYLQLLMRQKWALFITFVLIMGVGLSWILTRPRLYSAVAEMTVSRGAATEARLLIDVDLIHEAFSRLPAEARWKGFGTRRSSMQKYPYTVSVPKDTDIISVEVIASDPTVAALFANEIIQTDLEKHALRIGSMANQATQPINVEMAQCAKELQQSMTAVAVYKRSHGIADITSQVASEAQGLSNLQAQIDDAQREAARQQSMQLQYERQMRTISQVITTKAPGLNPIVSAIDGEIERLEQQRAGLLQEYMPTAPEIRAVDAQISAARQRREVAVNDKMSNMTTNQNPAYDSLQQARMNAKMAEQDARLRISITRNQLGQMRRQVANLPEVEKRMTELTNHVDELKTKLYDLAGQQRSLRVGAVTELSTLIPTVKARPDFVPVSPKYKASLMLLAVLAITLALAIAVMRDQFDDRLHTTEMLADVSGQRVLASLPQIRNGFRGLVTHTECPPVLLESFRILRANVLLAMRDQLTRIITVTSPQAGEGKSTTVVNLAEMIAIGGKKVLVIDCDLRHPSVHLYYGLENTRGLTSILLGEATVAECTQQMNTPGLAVITAGPIPAHSPELLASQEMVTLLATLSEQYNCILLDSPPILNLSDGVLLASLAQAAVLVVSFDRTRQPQLLEATRILNHVGVPIIGTVNNRSAEKPASNWLAVQQ